jgi:uncharacterized membrane protein (DUF373 family)
MDTRVPEAIRDASEEVSRGVRLSSGAFLTVEHGIMMALGIVLSLTALLALGGAVVQVWDGVLAAGSAKSVLVIVDRLLFVLMIVEILHTVRVSIRSGELTCEPFLIVGLIASIRRVLVITLETSQNMPGKTIEPGHEDAFQAAMIELGVLAGLILVMVVSIYLLRRNGPRTAARDAA